MLRMQGIEVGRTTAEVKLKEGNFPAGSYIVKRDQPYGRLAKTLLEKQTYPRSGHPHLRRRVVDDGDDEPDGGQGDRRQGGARPGGDAGEQRRQARRHRHRCRIAVRRRALRLEQHDHAALSAEGSEGAGGREGVQAGRPDLPGRLLHRQRRRREGPAGGRGARADRARPRRGAAGADARARISRASRSTPRGAAHRTWAGCASRSTSSSFPTI